MAKLNLDRQESDFLNNTIAHWEKENLVDAEQAARLRQSYEVKGFDWMRLAKYSIWVALFCGAIAIGSFIVDDAVINWIKNLYDTPDIVISLLSAVAAVGLFYLGRRRERQHPEQVFTNEATIFLGVFFTACCIAYLGKTFDHGSGHYSVLFLISVIVYAFLAYRMQSRLIWLFALVSLGSWFGTETGYQTNWAFYFLGMNYPLRFVAFGLMLVGASHLLKDKKWFNYFWDLTYVIGMLYLFMSLWLLSIFGNYGSLESWWQIKQISLYYWGIISAVVAGLFLLYGLKKKDVIAREFGITFLIISLYTKYFEYFWESTNKTIFFAILALSFWLVGRKAEKIWNVKIKSPSAE